MMAVRITVGVIVVVIISAWAYMVDNKSVGKGEHDDEPQPEKTEEIKETK